MKLKGLTKLALSGVALAAVAATLGTSTYAWYVTNSTAVAKGAKGAAKANGAGNVLLAQNSSAQDAVRGHTKFEQELTLSQANIINFSEKLLPTTPRAYSYAATSDATKQSNKSYYVNTAAQDADPVYVLFDGDAFASGTTYYERSVTEATTIDNNTVWFDSKGKEMNTSRYIQYDIWVSSSEATKLNLTYEFKNTTEAEAFEPQIAYANAGLPQGVESGQTFTMNVLDALRMSYTQTDYEITTTTTNTYTPVSGDFDNTVSYYTKSYEVEAVTSANFADKKAKLFVEDNNGGYVAVGSAAYDEDETYYVEKYTFADITEFADGTTYYTRTSASAMNVGDAQVKPTVFVDVANNASLTKKTAPNADFDFAPQTSSDANAYYTAVVGASPAYTSANTASTSAIQLTVPQGGETKLSFYIWIEGTDNQCFDSIAGQTFEFTYKFIAVEEADPVNP